MTMYDVQPSMGNPLGALEGAWVNEAAWGTWATEDCQTPPPPHTRRQVRAQTRAHTHDIQPLRTGGKPPTHSEMAHLRSPTEAWDRMGARLPRKPPPAAPMHMLTKAMRKLMTVGCWYSSCLKVTSCPGCNRQFMHGFSTSQQLLKQERWG